MAMYTRRRGVRLTWVHENIFAGGGGHIPADWQSFSDQTGVSSVLHLRPGQPEAFLGPATDAFLWLDIGEEAQADNPARWLAATFVNDCLSRNQRVLLHSSLGRHRTRWTYVAYLIYSGRSARGALRKAAQRPWLAPYHTDSTAWKAFAREVRAKRLGEQASGGQR